MPNKIIGKILNTIRAINVLWKSFSSDNINFALLGIIIKPFNIHYTVSFRNPKQIKLSKGCTIKNNTIINGRSEIEEFGIQLGENTYLKENCYLDSYGGFIKIKGKCAFGQNTNIHGGGGVEIGYNVIFGANCYIVASNHNFRSIELPIMLQGDNRKGIKIGNNTWLGGNVIVLDGVAIGDNCVIGAGTVVTRDIANNTKVISKKVLNKEIIYK